MRTKKEKKVMEVDKIYCDKCNKEIIAETESLTMNHTFGYYSNLDGERIKLDICEFCIPVILGNSLMEKGLLAGEK